jgi:predicted dehydrogenase
MVERFRDSAQLVGIFDPNAVRAHYAGRECGDVPVFENVDEMIHQTAIRSMGPTTSASGAAAKRTRAVCWCTRPPTTSTW